MTDKELIEELNKDRADNDAIDEACYKRLCRLADEYGDDGETARSILNIVRRLLNI